MPGNLYFDSSNILFKDKDYYIFNNLQESYKKVYILEDIYIVQLANSKYKVLDKNLRAIANGLADIQICDEVVIYSKNNKTYGLMNKQGNNITECKYAEIKEKTNYENNLIEKLETVYEDWFIGWLIYLNVVKYKCKVLYKANGQAFAQSIV